MIVREVLRNTETLLIPEKPLLVEQTSAAELLELLTPAAKLSFENLPASERGVFRLATAGNTAFPTNRFLSQAPKEKSWAYLRISADGAGELIVSEASVLYPYTMKLVEDFGGYPAKLFKEGKYYTTAFRWHRPLFDNLLTQVWRSARHFDPGAHIREMARAGYTHVEVNGMAALEPCEESVGGEFYAPFYSYGLALDQYVDSDLNRGIYPAEYLSANLNLLKENARLARKYGLEPGLLCFEPRSVPEKLLQEYPTLRGARVDHPFRSRKPRYTLALAHPRVQAHYRELMQKLLREVPDLAYMSIWSNDSGAGFEHTSSLYVGRNGGPYLIREWRTHADIAEAAGKNVVQFMRLLRDAAAEMNPKFRVSIRLEPFKDEHQAIMENLSKQLDIEAPSLLVRGYDLPYTHEKYSDNHGVAGTVHHIRMRPEESELLKKLESRGSHTHVIYSHGNGFNFEPLLGIPFPWLLFAKLQAMAEIGVEHAANLGGFTPSRFAPYHINQELFREFMLQPGVDVDEALHEKARAWAGKNADDLLDVWRQADEAIRRLPTIPLYTSFGFVWLRLWVRPIIPDLLAVPKAERRYYEDFMVSSVNNTNLTDLGRDVLFQLISQESGKQFVERVDAYVFPYLNKAIDTADKQAGDIESSKKSKTAFHDQHVRLCALRCWIGTLRSVAGWCAGVYGYLGEGDAKAQNRWRNYLDDIIDSEIRNARNLLELWNTSDLEFMAVSGSGETPFIYGENFGKLLERKIALMKEYRQVEPNIDRDIIWKV
ncbi:MAG: hypothetical protein ACE5IR_14070 [bacterium]